MRRHAGHDPLTGLPNRALFQDYLEHALARAQRADAMSALLLLDLDRFKGINDAFGLPCGDLLLQAVAARLQGCLRDTDPIARLGGDEFLVLQTEARGPEDPRSLARRLNDCFGDPFMINGEELHSSASIGITLFPADGQTPERLIKNAELAMYRAKSNGRNGSCFFAPQMNLVARRTGLLGARAAPGLRRRSVHGALPAAARAQDRPDRRHGGAAALAPPEARHGPADRVHRPRREHRPDRAPDRARARPCLPSAAAVAACRHADLASLGQSLADPVSRELRGHLDRDHACRDRHGAELPGDRADRRRDAREQRDRARQPAPSQPPGRTLLPRRLRHRLLVAGLCQAPAGPSPEDRSELRAPPRPGRPGRGDRAGDHRSRPQPGSEGHGRGRRDLRSARAARRSSAATRPRAT